MICQVAQCLQSRKRKNWHFPNCWRLGASGEHRGTEPMLKIVDRPWSTGLPKISLLRRFLSNLPVFDLF